MSFLQFLFNGRILTPHLSSPAPLKCNRSGPASGVRNKTHGLFQPLFPFPFSDFFRLFFFFQSHDEDGPSFRRLVGLSS